MIFVCFVVRDCGVEVLCEYSEKFDYVVFEYLCVLVEVFVMVVVNFDGILCWVFSEFI